MSARVASFQQAAPTGTGTSLVIPAPANIHRGDLLIAVIALDPTWSDLALSGWSAITGITNAQCGGCLFKIAEEADETAADFTFTWTTAQERAGIIMRIDRHGGIDVANRATSASSTSPTCPSVTATVNNVRVLRFMVADDDDAPFNPQTNVDVQIIANAHPTTAGPSLCGGYAINLAASGATGTFAFSIFAAEENDAYTIAIKPATLFKVEGITKDNNGDVLPSCIVKLFKNHYNGDVELISSGVSDGTTGSFTLNCFDQDPLYSVVGRKSGTPNLFDVTDFNITPVAI